jgi:hypothetical protein
VLVRFSLFLINVKTVTARKDEVEGAETHKMDILEPHTSGVASSLRPVSACQDINDEAQLAVPPVEGVTSIWPSCRILRRLFCSVTGSGGSNALEMSLINWTIDQSRGSDNVSHTRLIRTNAQSRARFLMIVEISMT